jgi:hypothetical protein
VASRWRTSISLSLVLRNNFAVTARFTQGKAPMCRSLRFLPARAPRYAPLEFPGVFAQLRAAGASIPTRGRLSGLGTHGGLREFLQDDLAGSDQSQLEAWLAWAQRSRLAAFRDLARTIKRHHDGVLAYMETRLTNGVMEAINGLLQLAKCIARGFRNFHHFRHAAHLKAGGLNLQAPRLLPTWNVEEALS